MERLTEKHYGTNGYFMKCSEDCANDDEMCGGCPYLDKIIDRLGAYEDTGLTPEQVAAIAKDNNVPGKWIPVTERLPEVAWRVLVTDGTNVNFGYTLCFEIKGVSPWCTLSPVMPDKVTHWMPLPQPPKGE